MPSSHGLFTTSLFKSRSREPSGNQLVATEPEHAPVYRQPNPPCSPSASSSTQSSNYRNSLRRSISQIDIVNPLRRSISLRSGLRSDFNPTPISPRKPNNVLTFPAFVLKRQRSSDDFAQRNRYAWTSVSHFDPSKPPHHSNMASVQYRNPPPTRPSGAGQSSMSYTQNSNGTLGSSVPAGQSQNPQAVYQHIQDMASKRISTLDYLRKSHEGRVYWFNTLLFTKSDLLKLPYFSPAKLARRATNFLLLGFSLPMILDLNSQTANEYLKALNALLHEFEQYQNMHPPDGGSTSSLSRARIPQMFKRATGAAASKSRRMTDAGLSALTPTDSSGLLNSSSASTNTAASGAAGSSTSTLLTGSSLPMMSPAEPLLPTEQYTHLLTPPLPFDPDFFETFATLCDVLIDCYSRVTHLVSGPETCAPGTGVAELFAKADARVRKIIVSGVVREFEDRCREGVKGEMAGVGKVVLGGLM